MTLINNILRMLVGGTAVSSAQSSVSLESAGSYGALAPASISNTGDTVINGDIGSTGTSVTGFPPGLYSGSLNVDNGAADQAQADFTAAYIQGQGLASTMSYGAMASLAGLVLQPGVFSFDSAVTLDGTLTLSGAGEYIIQIGSSLTTSSGSVVSLTNGASACSVYWIVNSAATLGSTSAFAGNVLTGTGITLITGATVQGSLYAGSAITLDSNRITACGEATGPSNSTTSSSIATSTSSAIATSLSSSSTTSNSSFVAPTTPPASSTLDLTSFYTSTTSRNSSSSLGSPVTTGSSGLPSATHNCTESLVSPVAPPVYYTSTLETTTTISAPVYAAPSGYKVHQDRHGA